MKCHYCGAELKEKEIFCSCCGTRRAAPVIIEEKIGIPESAPQIREAPASGHFEDFCPEPAVPQAKPVSRPTYVPYGAPVKERPWQMPALQLPAARSLPKMIFLGIITLGIYPLVIWCRLVTELNIAASRYDGERTMSYLGMWMLAPITLCLYPIVWIHGFCRRIGEELSRRGLPYEFGARDFWLWNVLGTFILVGPFVFLHKLLRSMNMINKDYNVRG